MFLLQSRAVTLTLNLMTQMLRASHYLKMIDHLCEMVLNSDFNVMLCA